MLGISFPRPATRPATPGDVTSGAGAGLESEEGQIARLQKPLEEWQAFWRLVEDSTGWWLLGAWRRLRDRLAPGLGAPAEIVRVAPWQSPPANLGERPSNVEKGWVRTDLDLAEEVVAIVVRRGVDDTRVSAVYLGCLVRRTQATDRLIAACESCPYGNVRS
jgi:hypothetical protein